MVSSHCANSTTRDPFLSLVLCVFFFYSPNPSPPAEIPSDVCTNLPFPSLSAFFGLYRTVFFNPTSPAPPPLLHWFPGNAHYPRHRPSTQRLFPSDPPRQAPPPVLAPRALVAFLLAPSPPRVLFTLLGSFLCTHLITTAATVFCLSSSRYCMLYPLFCLFVPFLFFCLVLSPVFLYGSVSSLCVFTLHLFILFLVGYFVFVCAPPPQTVYHTSGPSRGSPTHDADTQSLNPCSFVSVLFFL